MRLHRSVFVFYGIAALAAAGVAVSPELGLEVQDAGALARTGRAAPEPEGATSAASPPRAIAEGEGVLPTHVDLQAPNPIQAAAPAAPAATESRTPPPADPPAPARPGNGYTSVSFEPGRPMVNPTGLPLN